MRCVQLAVENPPASGDPVHIYNQATETHRLIELAELLVAQAGAEIHRLPNPRKEALENDLDLENKTFLRLGLNPTRLEDGLLSEVMNVAKKYAHRCDLSKIPPSSFWTSDRQQQAERGVVEQHTGAVHGGAIQRTG